MRLGNHTWKHKALSWAREGREWGQYWILDGAQRRWHLSWGVLEFMRRILTVVRKKLDEGYLDPSTDQWENLHTC